MPSHNFFSNIALISLSSYKLLCIFLSLMLSHNFLFFNIALISLSSSLQISMYILISFTWILLSFTHFLLSPLNSELFEFSWLGFSSKSIIFAWPSHCSDRCWFCFHHSCWRTMVFHIISSISFVCVGFMQWVHQRLSLLFSSVDTFPLQESMLWIGLLCELETIRTDPSFTRVSSVTLFLPSLVLMIENT